MRGKLSTQPASPIQPASMSPRGVRGEHSALGSSSPFSHLMPAPSPLTPHSLLSSRGFTIFEMLIVLMLLGGIMVIVVPRMMVNEDLSSAGRKFIGTFRTLQRMAETGRKPVKLYLDLDQGTYWAMVIDGKEERRLHDIRWVKPRAFPDMIRMTEVSKGKIKWTYGRVDLLFHPNGRIDPVNLYFSDAQNNLLVLVVDSVTGNIRTLDQRPEFIRPRPIPDRVRTLLQASAQK